MSSPSSPSIRRLKTVERTVDEPMTGFPVTEVLFGTLPYRGWLGKAAAWLAVAK